MNILETIVNAMNENDTTSIIEEIVSFLYDEEFVTAA